MAEKQRCQEGHRQCANNCGFFGSPATMDLCSKCYGDYRIKEDPAAALSTASSSSSAFSPSSSTSVVAKGGVAEAAPAVAASPSAPKAAAPSRCACCRKKVGLTGFTCRCGATFCGTHRYPERHSCSFDFKAAGRDAIARANPVVKADKLHDKI